MCTKYVTNGFYILQFTFLHNKWSNGVCHIWSLHLLHTDTINIGDNDFRKQDVFFLRHYVMIDLLYVMTKLNSDVVYVMTQIWRNVRKKNVLWRIN